MMDGTLIAGASVALAGLAALALRRRRRTTHGYAWRKQRVAPKPTPGEHTCKHQRNAHLRCAVPSCPGGVTSRLYRVKVQEGRLSREAVFERARTAGGWTWRLRAWEG